MTRAPAKIAVKIFTFLQSIDAPLVFVSTESHNKPIHTIVTAIKVPFNSLRSSDAYILYVQSESFYASYMIIYIFSSSNLQTKLWDVVIRRLINYGPQTLGAFVC